MMILLELVLYCLLFFLLVKGAARNSGRNCLYFYSKEYLIERILNKKTTILKDIASAENLRKWKNLEKDYNRQTAYAEE